MAETSGRGRAAPRTQASGAFRHHRALIAVAVAGALVEAAVLSAVAPAARPLAPQVTALAPLAVFHDLRWLFGYHRSWLTFALGLAVLLLARSALNTVLVRLAWPRGVPRPSYARTFWSGLALLGMAVAVISPIVAVVFGVALLPFSWPFLPALPAMVLIALPLSHGGVMSSWWRTLPPLPAVGWVLADVAFLSVASAVIGLLPAAGAIPAAGLAGLVNARAWYGLTAAVGRRYAATAAREPARRVPLVRLAHWAPVSPLAAVLVLGLIAGATHEVFSAAAGRPAAGAGGTVTAGTSAGRVAEPAGLTGRDAGPGGSAGPGSAAAGTAAGASGGASGKPAPARTGDPVLLIEGFGSPCCNQAGGLQQSEHGRIVQQFSYRGLDAAGHPRPHGRAASDLPLPLLGDRIGAQVERLHAESGQPVDLVAESEGTLGVYAVLTRHPGAAVGSIVLASPIVAPGQASYQADQREGRDVASGYALRYIAKFIGRLSPFGPSGAVTLINSVSSVGAHYEASAAQHHAVRVLAVVPLADALTLPACALPSSVAVVPGFHGGLLGKPAVQQMVHAFLAGHEVHGQRRFSEASEILAAAGAGWRMPQITQPSPPCPG